MKKQSIKEMIEKENCHEISCANCPFYSFTIGEPCMAVTWARKKALNEKIADQLYIKYLAKKIKLLKILSS